MFTRIIVDRLSTELMSLFSQPPLRRTDRHGRVASRWTLPIDVNRLGFEDPAETGVALPVSMTIFGPGSAPPVQVERRLERAIGTPAIDVGPEAIRLESTIAGHLAPLAPSDLIVWGIRGRQSVEALVGVLLAGADAADRALWQWLSSWMGDSEHRSAEPAFLTGLVQSANPPENHPIFELLLDAPMEDAVRGGQEGVERLTKRIRSPGMDSTELAIARANVLSLDHLGKESIAEWLSALAGSGAITTWRAVSDTNAFAAFDFEVDSPRWSRGRLTVKSTRGTFDNPIHISLAELREMASGGSRIARVFDVTAADVQVRFSGDLSAFAKGVLAALDHLPAGVRSDGISVDTANLPWEPQTMTIPGP